MLTAYALKANADMTEGHGPMVTRAYFLDEDSAWAIADTMSGVMGRKPSSGTWRPANPKFDSSGDITVDKIIVYSTVDEYIKANASKLEQIRRSALSKLSSLEREVLGV